MEPNNEYVWDLARAVRPHGDPPGVTKFTVAEMAAAAVRLEALLVAHNLRPHPVSWIRAAIETAKDLPATAVGRVWVVNSPERIARMQMGSDVLLITRLVEDASGALLRAGVERRLQDLCRGDHAASSASPRSLERDLAFEMVCAGWLSRFAEDVAFEEPDLICRHGGAKWGAACKAAYGKAATAADAIEKGARQVQKASCEAGIVLMRITDVFPHDEMPGFDAERGAVLSCVHALDAFNLVHRAAKSRVVDDVVTALGQGGVASLCVKYPKLKAVAFVGHTVVHLHVPSGAVPTVVPMLISLPDDVAPSRFVIELFDALRL